MVQTQGQSSELESGARGSDVFYTLLYSVTFRAEPLIVMNNGELFVFTEKGRENSEGRQEQEWTQQWQSVNYLHITSLYSHPPNCSLNTEIPICGFYNDNQFLN